MVNYPIFRGPKSARVSRLFQLIRRQLRVSYQIYTETRDALADPGQTSAQEVLVLQGGFAAFQAAYKVCYQILFFFTVHLS